MPEFHEADAEIVYFSGKQAEEIGFEKFHRRQAKLQGIRVLVLDRMQIHHGSPSQQDEIAISEICADITDLDLSGNLFETFVEVVRLCTLMPKLRVLTLDGNRFSIPERLIYPSLSHLHTLSLATTLLSQVELNHLIAEWEAIMPSLQTLNLAGNEYTRPFKAVLPISVTSLDLSDNEFTSLSDLINTSVNKTGLDTLVLKRNRISSVHCGLVATPKFSLSVTELDLSYNAITSLTFFNDINPTTLPRLKHLRVTGNPVYKNLVSAEGMPLTVEDGYMLTIARLPQIETLNYSKVTEKERLNAETYYLNQIAVELARAPEDQKERILRKHPRYQELCEEYGEPTVQRESHQNAIDPNTLAAKLVTVTFILASGFLEPREWKEEIPKSFNIYAVLGLVAKKLNCFSLELRLVLETNERDPVGRDSAYAGPQWWDSSDDDVEEDRHEWVKREVELIAGTRTLGTFVEGSTAVVRVARRGGNG
jgi:tubulin-specific chaperone E